MAFHLRAEEGGLEVGRGWMGTIDSSVGSCKAGWSVLSRLARQTYGAGHETPACMSAARPAPVSSTPAVAIATPGTQDKLQQLGAEYERRVQVAAAEARLAAQREAAEQRRSLQAAAREELRSCGERLAEAQAAAAAAAAAAEDGATLERARHAADLARLREQAAAELRAVLEESAASLAQREAEHSSLLAELRRLRAAMSAAPSRAGTRQEAHGWQPAAGAWATAGSQALHQQPPQQRERERRGATPPPGQLMELASDEDEEHGNGGMQQQELRRRQQQGEEQPRQTHELLWRLQAAQAALRPQAARPPQQ